MGGPDKGTWHQIFPFFTQFVRTCKRIAPGKQRAVDESFAAPWHTRHPPTSVGGLGQGYVFLALPPPPRHSQIETSEPARRAFLRDVFWLLDAKSTSRHSSSHTSINTSTHPTHQLPSIPAAGTWHGLPYCQASPGGGISASIDLLPTGIVGHELLVTPADVGGGISLIESQRRHSSSAVPAT